MTRNASIVLCLSSLLASQLHARTWWVAPSSASQTRLGTETHPLVGVQVGLDSAGSGDTVILAEGTYQGSGYVNRGKGGIVLGSRMLVDGDTAHVEKTVLDGLHDDSIPYSAKLPILRLALGDTASFSVTGLTFRRGVSSRGGAVDIWPATAGAVPGVLFTSVVFRNNTALQGGAVHGGMNVFRNCRFSDNRAMEESDGSLVTSRGGAYSGDSALAAPHGSRWIGCVFERNRSRNYAGAISEWKAPTISDCRFEENSAAYGGAILHFAKDTMVVGNTVFRGNVSRGSGGALVGNRTRLSGCLIEGNKASNGGVMYAWAERVVVERSVVRNNEAGSYAGFFGADLVATESDFIGNRSLVGDAAVVYGGPLQARRCRFLSNRAANYGGITNSSSLRLEECLVAGNTAGQGNIAFTASVTAINSTLAGSAGSSSADVFMGSIDAEGSVLDLFQQGGTLALRSSLVHGTRTQATIDAAKSRDHLLDVDPGFLNPLAGDYRLKPTSPAVDRGDSTLDASREPSCPGRAARRDLGYHGNTSDATCPGEQLETVAFEPKAIVRTLRVGEVLRDSSRFHRSGSGSFDPEATLSVIGNAVVPPPGPLVDGLWIQVRDTAVAAGTSTSTIRVRARASGADEGCTVTATILPQPIDSIFGAVWHSRGALLGTTVRDTFLLVNRGANTVRIDSAATTSPRFQIVGSLAGAVVPPGGSRQVVVAFTSNTVAPVRARLRLWSAAFAWPDTGVALAGAAYDANATPLPPVALVHAVVPREVDWNGAFSAVGVAWDDDAMGSGAPITAWQWIVGADTIRSAAVAGHPASKLALGWNRLQFRARDNEGVWSSLVTDSVFVRGGLPVFDSLGSSKGVLLRQDGDLVLAATAHDADEGAVAGGASDGIARIVWHSDLDGILDTGARVSIPSARLRIGTHAIWAVAVDDEGDSAASDTLHLPVQTSIGLAVVVAGTSFGDISYHLANISPNANWIYQTLRSRGYSDEQIWYANRIGWQSLGDPFVDARIVDETAITRAILRQRLLSLKPAVEAGTPLLVAFVGHGDASEQDGGRFFLNDSESVTPWDLNNWLGEYDGIDSAGQLVVVLDFCESGAFQTALRSGFDRHRVVVTSADADHPAYFVRGKGFSQVFFAGVRKGRSLARSFQDAKSWSDLAGPAGNPAGPLLNADMNGAWNTDADILAAGSVWIGGVRQNQTAEPEIDSGWMALSSAGPAVAAKLAGTASRAWIEYRLASDDPSAAPRVVPMRETGDGIWTASWTGGSDATDLFVHAANASGALAFPWSIDASGMLGGDGARKVRTARYDRSLGRIVLGRRIGAGETLDLEVLDVAGRGLGRASAQADASGWVDVSWRPVRSGFHILRVRWPSGSETARVLVTEVR